MDDARAWLKNYGLLTEDDDDNTARRRHIALSKCKFGAGVDDDAKRRFLQQLIPYELHLAAK